MRTFAFIIATVAFLCATVATGQTTTCSVAIPNAQVMNLGNDGRLYVAADSLLQVVDLQKCSVISSTPLGTGDAQRPVDLCLLSDGGEVVPLQPITGGSWKTNPTQTAFVAANGSVRYVQPDNKFWASGCATNYGTVLLSSSLSSTVAPYKLALVRPDDLSVEEFFSVDSGVPYVATQDGKNFLILTSSQTVSGFSGGLFSATYDNGGITLSNLGVPLEGSPSAKPVFSSDGNSLFVPVRVFVSYNGSTITYKNEVQQVDLPSARVVATYNWPTTNVVAISGKERAWLYALAGKAVGLFDLTSGQFLKTVVTPDGSSNTQQLLVLRQQYSDRLVILETNSVLAWDEARAAAHINAVISAAATGGATVAPGNWFSVYGWNLSYQPVTAQIPEGDNFPTSLGGTQVLVNGVPTMVWYVSPNQVNAWLPSDTPLGNASVVVRQQTADGGWVDSQPATLLVAQFAPGGYALTGGNGFGTWWGAGLGPVVDATGKGQKLTADEPAPAAPLYVTATTPTVTVGGAQAAVSFSGLTPGCLGLYQVNFTIPDGVVAGDCPVVLSIGGMSSQPMSLRVVSAAAADQPTAKVRR